MPTTGTANLPNVLLIDIRKFVFPWIPHRQMMLKEASHYHPSRISLFSLRYNAIMLSPNETLDNYTERASLTHLLQSTEEVISVLNQIKYIKHHRVMVHKLLCVLNNNHIYNSLHCSSDRRSSSMTANSADLSVITTKMSSRH